MKKSSGTGAKLLTILRPKGLGYLLRDEFTTDVAAPMGTSPIIRTCEPGPGQLRLSQQDSVAEWRIVGGILEVSAQSTIAIIKASTPTGFTRTPGLAFKTRVRQDPIGTGGSATLSPMAGWATANNNPSAAIMTGVFWQTGQAFIMADIGASTSARGLITSAASTFYVVTVVLRDTGGFTFINDRLAYVHAVNSTATMYPAVYSPSSGGRHTPSIDYMRVAQLGGPFATSHGLALSRKAGACAVGDTLTTLQGGCFIEFTIDSLPSTGEVLIQIFKQDDNNHWRISLDSAGTVRLQEVTAGTPVNRNSIASNLAGDRIVLAIDGGLSRFNRMRGIDTTAGGTYSPVSAFTTNTGGVVSSLGTGGAISNLISWPHYLTGEAKNWIDML